MKVPAAELRASIYSDINHSKNRPSCEGGIQENTGFPRIKYGAGIVEPRMTNRIRLMSSCINSEIRNPYSKFKGWAWGK